MENKIIINRPPPPKKKKDDLRFMIGMVMLLFGGLLVGAIIYQEATLMGKVYDCGIATISSLITYIVIKMQLGGPGTEGVE